MWTSDVNDIKALEAFSTLLEKDQPSKGDFTQDYLSFAQSNGIIQCPYIASYGIGEGENRKEGIRISNGVIDLPSWRAALLAVATIGSKVSEIQIHSSSLSSTHLQDLGKALSKSVLVKKLKIQYSELYQPAEDISTVVVPAFKAIFAESTNLELISLKNNNVSDQIVKGFAPVLTENYRLVSLTLSESNLSDETCAIVLQAIKFNPNYRVISLSDNGVTGTTTLNTILSQYVGALNTANDDAALKANAKALNDRNKAVKDLNKKRKKANLPEFNEFPSLPEFTKAYEGKQQYFANRVLEYLDFTGNPIEANDLLQFSTLLDTLPASLLPDVKLKLLLTAPKDLDPGVSNKINSFIDFL